MSDVFLSYSSADRQRVKPIVEALEQRGWSVWWDHHIVPGRRWDETLGVELAAARCVVLVWSKHSVESEWVRTEAHEARQRKVLVPALIDEVDIPFGYKTIHAVRLTGWSGKPEHPELEILASAVADVLSRNPTAPNVGSTRDRAESMVARAVRRRTQRMTSILGAVVLIFGLVCCWYLLAVHPVAGPAAALGLRRIDRGKYSSDENERLGSRIRNAQHSIKLLLPNASSLSQTFREDFSKFFQTQGTTMQVIFATPGTPFYKEMSQMTLGDKWAPKDLTTNEGFVGTSRQRLLDAANQDQKRIEFRYFDTQFRLPILIIDNQYCFVTLRLPPNEGGESPRLEFDGENSFVRTCEVHFQGVWNASSVELPAVASSGGTPEAKRP